MGDKDEIKLPDLSSRKFDPLFWHLQEDFKS